MRLLLALALIFASVTTYNAPAAANSSISIVDMSSLLGAVEQAQTVTVTAYVLSMKTHLAQALVAAHDRGARVVLELSSSAFGPPKRTNAETAAVMKSHGINVLFSQGPLHAKIAIVDRQMYLSDRNWDNKGGFIILDRYEPDRNVVAGLLRGVPGSDDHFWTQKSDALAYEARVISMSGRTINFESESFGGNNVVYNALLRRAQQGATVRVIVARMEYERSESEQRYIQELKAAHIQVRIGETNEKMALNGPAIWFGSSNATRGLATQIDWGMAMIDASLAQTLTARFEDNWNAAEAV